MKKITLGIIAHVDSGKTTLSEALLYTSGKLRSFGRVDKGESFLDSNELERKRGITIYSRQASFEYGDTAFTLLDTPGHSDFSAEMERTLQVIDYALLIISASDGIKGQTETLWKLLSDYDIPVIIFFNKMDQPGNDSRKILSGFRSQLEESCADMTGILNHIADGRIPQGIAGRELEAFYDMAAMCSEEAMEEYLSSGRVSFDTITDLIFDRKLFPCFFGSALKGDGIRTLLTALDILTLERDFPEEFGARVFKILRDSENRRLTFLKVTGGQLKVRDTLPDGDSYSKIDQIRIYSGDKFVTANEVSAGDICAIDGLEHTFSGQGFGYEAETILPVLSPVLSYSVIPPEGTDLVKCLADLRKLEEESPELSVRWNEDTKEITVCVMGSVQLEIIKAVFSERFGLNLAFGNGKVLYKETVTGPVKGVGHFEPLRHYAEVHLLIEPLPEGSGIEYACAASQDVLALNWQRLILTHLLEKEHKGVLTGSPVTDIRITIVGGRANNKHTTGGDFRQATYRAVRQGLMMAESRLLEPYFRFTLKIPQSAIGRAMTDLDRMKAEFTLPESSGEDAILQGRVAAAALRDYANEIAAYTKGKGSITTVPCGYGPCHNPEEVISDIAYDPTADMANSPDSVFCANGAGYIVPYDEVYDHMHVPLSEDALDLNGQSSENAKTLSSDTASSRRVSGRWLGTEEVDAILSGVARSGADSSSGKPGWKKRRRRYSGFGMKDTSAAAEYASKTGAFSNRMHGTGKTAVFHPESCDYMLVDGYNVIFAWEDLSDLARENVDSARISLLEILCNYQAYIGCELIVVFDAYRVKGHVTEYFNYRNIHVVFTKEAETADQYIERFAHEHGKKYRVTVVTSDGLEQIIIRGQGAALISSRELKMLIDERSL